LGQVAVYQGHDRAYLAGLFNGSREIAAGQTLAPLFMYAAHIPVFYDIGKIQCFHCLFKMWSTDKILACIPPCFQENHPCKSLPVLQFKPHSRLFGNTVEQPCSSISCNLLSFFNNPGSYAFCSLQANNSAYSVLQSIP
jgi:hypothetical protein